MKDKVSLKDFDFAVQMIMLCAWGASALWPVLHRPQTLPYMFPLLAVVSWLIIDAWWQWRGRVEDERVRHIILMSGYVSRQITLGGALILMLVSMHVQPGPLAWPATIAALLLVPDMIMRRAMGLRSEELDQDRPAWQTSTRRILYAVAIAFPIVLILGARYFLFKAYH